jgi:hypothetical protein
LFVNVAPPLRLNPSALPDDTLPELPTVQVAPLPSMPSFPAPVEVTVPVEVMVRGLSVAGLRVTGPVTPVLIVLDIYLTLFDPKISLKVKGFEP